MGKGKGKGKSGKSKGSSEDGVAGKPKAADFDFIRFLVADLNGIARCKTVTRSAFNGFSKGGPGMFSGTLALAPDDSIVDLPILAGIGFGDLKAKPARDASAQVRPIPWASAGEHSVGAVLCEPVWAVGEKGPQEACPRAVARRLCDTLAAEHSLKILHASEMEFVLFDDKGEPAFPNDTFFVAQAFSSLQDELMKASKLLGQAGVQVETLQTEYGKGQVEIVIRPEMGIAGADNAFIFKNGMKEMLCHGLGRERRATFMSRPIFDSIGSSCHFNHSLWHTGKGKKDAMWDDSRETKLTETAEHWLAGILKHAPGLSALMSPTPNCWRRLHQAFTPNNITWGVENRLCMVRVKAEGPGSGTYFENRLGGAAANPYLALAGVVAAGMDGLKKKLPLCPSGPNGNDAAGSLPTSLEEALCALEKDTDLTELLGKELVQWFTVLKRMEAKVCKEKAEAIPRSGGVKEGQTAEFMAEFEYYSKWI